MHGCEARSGDATEAAMLRAGLETSRFALRLLSEILRLKLYNSRRVWPERKASGAS